MKLFKNYRTKKSLREENMYLERKLHEQSCRNFPRLEIQEKKVAKLKSIVELPDGVPFDVVKKAVLRNLIEEADQYVAYGTDINKSNGTHILTGELTIVKE